MMNEELYLKSRMGNKNPFSVPEGYFDNFAVEMMRNLPEQPQQSKFVRLRPLMYAAACLLVAILTATIFFFPPENTVEPNIAAVSTTTDTYVEDVADYVMADNIDIYACLASEY